MLENFTKKLAQKMGKSVKEQIQPIVNETSKKVDSKVDLYSKILRLFVLGLLFIEGTKKATNDFNQSQTSGPSQIVINNYLCERKDDEE